MNSLKITGLKTLNLGPVDLDIAAGECVCLSGASGSGKSLTLRAVADLDPHEGDISLDGDRASSMNGPAWRRQVGLLPAESAWWGETVGEHFGEIDEGLMDKLGFEREALTWKISRLSTGERQRLALLRLLMNKPRALLLDEPTASLDRENIKRVEELVKDYRRQQNAAVLWVSHDPEQIARVSDRLVTIKDHALVEAV
jgi:putative ABC transport system ATP-binding protein